MKKLLVLLTVACLILAAVPTFTLPASAVDIEGDWWLLRAPWDYGEEGYTPTPGYQYTDEGFTTIPTDYTNMTPFFTLQSKEAQNIRDGIYMELRVDEFAYGGDTGEDHWISFNLSTIENIAPGNTDYCDNWVSLVRGDGNGTASAQSFTTTTSESGGSFDHTGDVSINIPVDEQGREIYTFEIEWDGTQYYIYLCGTLLAGMEAVTKKLNQFNENGDFLVGVTFHSGVNGGKAGCTMLRYGMREADATPPVGSEYVDPEPNTMVFGDVIDPSTVEAGQPAALWDTTKQSFGYDPGGTDLIITAQGDCSYNILATGTNPYFV